MYIICLYCESLKPIDNYILDYETDDTRKIEPVNYLPIICMSLINGSLGIGTGYSTKVPNYNPRDVIFNIKNKINGDSYKKMIPWYRNFKGNICVPDWNGKQYNEINKMYSKGIYTIKSNTIIVDELPVGIWTDNYKEFLENAQVPGIGILGDSQKIIRNL